MKITVSLYDFTEAFKRFGRQDQFSYEGLHMLFEYLENLEQDMGVDLELDVIALCCDYCEMTYQEVLANYDTGITEEEYCDRLVWEWLEKNTSVVYMGEEKIMFQQF
jgi:hypothetical protein